MITISVLITCHNRREKTIECLAHLFSASLTLKSLHKLMVFLVVDGCTDGTGASVTELFPQVKIIEGSGELFWNRGMHLAWTNAAEYSYSDFYLWLNDDTFLAVSSLELLLESSIKCENKAIIVGSTKSISTNSITYGGRSENDELLVPNNTLQACHHFNGNAILIPDYVYKILGKLDPIFHHALGDFDYGLRARAANIHMYIAPDYVGSCEGHDSFARWCQPKYSLRERYTALYTSSCDCNPQQFFIFESRHYGYLIAIFHWVTIHIRLLVPSIWNKMKSY